MNSVVNIRCCLPLQIPLCNLEPLYCSLYDCLCSLECQVRATSGPSSSLARMSFDNREANSDTIANPTIVLVMHSVKLKLMLFKCRQMITGVEAAFVVRKRSPRFTMESMHIQAERYSTLLDAIALAM